MTTPFQQPVLPSDEDQEARAIGNVLLRMEIEETEKMILSDKDFWTQNVLLRMEIEETEARQWTARLRGELFTEDVEACLAAKFLVSRGAKGSKL